MTVKPRLLTVREQLGIKNPSLDQVLYNYYEWATYPEWLVFQGQSRIGYYAPDWKDKNRIFISEVKWKVAKASKRGNGVYTWRLKKRLKILEDAKKSAIDYFTRGLAKKTSSALFVTLTYAPDIPLGEAWQRIGEDYNRWITRIRKQYGKCSIIRTWEAHQKPDHRGYPHIHILLIFHTATFTVFRYKSRWRIEEKPDFEWEWGFSDVQAMESIPDGIKYITKYIKKVHGHIRNNLTLALTWFYRKQSFSLSRTLSDLIRAVRNSNLQDDMTDEEPMFYWKLVGFYGGSLQVPLSSDRIGWNFEIAVQIFRDLFGCSTWTDFRYKRRSAWFDD